MSMQQGFFAGSRALTGLAYSPASQAYSRQVTHSGFFPGSYTLFINASFNGAQVLAVERHDIDTGTYIVIQGRHEVNFFDRCQLNNTSNSTSADYFLSDLSNYFITDATNRTTWVFPSVAGVLSTDGHNVTVTLTKN